MKQHWLDRLEQHDADTQPRWTDRVTLITRDRPAGTLTPERTTIYYGSPPDRCVTIERYQSAPRRATVETTMIRPCYRPGPITALDYADATRQLAALDTLPVARSTETGGHKRVVMAGPWLDR
jgi:hypothetical protein